MLNASLFLDGATFFAGAVCLSKSPFASSLQQPVNLSGMAVSSTTNAFALAATSQRSEAEKAAALACATLFLCFIAKPLTQRTAIHINPYAAIQLTAFHALLKATLYGLYKLAKHFTVSVSFNPTTAEDIKKIAVSQLGIHKAELERSMEKKWDTFNLNMQAAFNVMLVENGQTALPFTNYIRVAPLTEKELQVFQDFVGDHVKNKEQAQVLFDHKLPPPSHFDALPSLSPTTVSIPTLSSAELLWYYQAFKKKLTPLAQIPPFTLEFYRADLLPPTDAFFTPLPIPASAATVSERQAHYFVNYDRHHPAAFDNRTEEEQAILNEIFVKAGQKPHPLKTTAKPPIEDASWSTAKKVMIYGGCALAIIALVAVPTALFLINPTNPTTPAQDNTSQLKPCFPPAEETNTTVTVLNDTIALQPDSRVTATLANQSSIYLAGEHSQEAHKTTEIFNNSLRPCFPEVTRPVTYEAFPQETFKIDLSHLIQKPYEPTPPDRAVSLIYPSLASRYAVCTSDEKPQLETPLPVYFPLPQEHLQEAHKTTEIFNNSLRPCFPEVTRPVTYEAFLQETFKIDLSHLIQKPCEPTPPDRAISLLYPSLASRYAVCSPDQKPIPTVLNHVNASSTSEASSPSLFSWKALGLLAVPLFSAIAGIYQAAQTLRAKSTRKNTSQQMVVFPQGPQKDVQILVGRHEKVPYIQFSSSSSELLPQQWDLMVNSLPSSSSTSQFTEVGEGFRRVTILNPHPRLLQLVQQQLAGSRSLPQQLRQLTIGSGNRSLLNLSLQEHPRAFASSSPPLRLTMEPSSTQLICQPTLYSREELMHEHEMRPARKVDRSLWATDSQHLSKAFKKLSYYTIQTLTGCSDYDGESSGVAENFSQEELNQIAKLVAKITAEKAKVSWDDIESFSFDFHRLRSNFTCVIVRVKLKRTAYQRLRLPQDLFTDYQYTYPPPSVHPKEPLLYDNSAGLSLAAEIELTQQPEILKNLIAKLSKVQINLDSWSSSESKTLEDEQLQGLPYELTSLLKFHRQVDPNGESWKDACKVVKDLAQKIAKDAFKVNFKEIDFYDLQIMKTKSTISFIVTVTLGKKKAANASTFFSSEQLKQI